jgi:hypothetical protein
MVFKRKKRPEISKPTNFQHLRKTYFDINSQTLKDLPPQWTSILTDEDISRTAMAAYEHHRQREQKQYSNQQSRPKPLIGDPCFLTPSDLEFLKVCFLIKIYIQKKNKLFLVSNYCSWFRIKSTNINQSSTNKST